MKRKHIGTTMNRRGFLSLSGAAAATAFSGCASCAAAPNAKEYFVDWTRNRLVMPWPGMKEKVKLRVIGDTHFNFYDERDAGYVDNYSRMAGGARGKVKHLPEVGAFEKFWDIITEAKATDCDAIFLVGDILSFPTLANVEATKRLMDAASVPCYFISGNHDWHFEGLPGTSTELRATWVEKRLKPLYPEGADPLMYSVVIKGVRVVAIDNSNFFITPGQLAFWKAEAAKGEPVALLMHIPIWAEGADDTHFAAPKWGAAVDPYFEIERRPRWPEKANKETYEFREAVLATPNLVGVFTGHVHRYMSARSNGQNFFSVRSGKNQLDVTIG